MTLSSCDNEVGFGMDAYTPLLVQSFWEHVIHHCTIPLYFSTAACALVSR